MKIQFEIELPKRWLQPNEDLSLIAKAKLAEFLANRWLLAQKQATEEALQQVVSTGGGSNAD